MWHDILIFTRHFPTGNWANKPRQQLKKQQKAKASKPKGRRVFGDESSSSSEDDGRSLRQLLESSEEEQERGGQVAEAGGEGDQLVSTQMDGHEENRPDFDVSPL